MRSRSVVLVVCSATLCSMPAACGGGDTTAPPTATSITIAPTTTTLDAIGANTQLTATVTDQHGQTMPAASVTWTSANTSVVSVGATGLTTTATAVANGTAEVTAAAGKAIAEAVLVVSQTATTLTTMAGDGQTAVAGSVLPAPLVAQVTDRSGHAAAGAGVTFVASVGSAVPTVDTSDASGRVSTTWTLGTTAGPQQLRVVLAGHDSVTFMATATPPTPPKALAINSVTPSPIVDGQPFIINGSGFDATPANNVVTVDGAVATVTAATATQLSVITPAMGCTPARPVVVSVQTGGKSASSTPVPMRPASYTTLAIGQETIVQDPSQFCFQLPSGADNAQYIVGLSAPAELPATTMPFQVTATAGGTVTGDQRVGTPVPVAAMRSQWGTTGRASRARRAVSGLQPVSGAVSRASALVWRNRARAELRLRRWERRLAPVLAARRAAGAIRPTAMGTVNASVTVPAVGDTLALRVPDINASNACASYDTVRAAVRVVGTAGIWMQDVANPTDDSLTLADIQTASDKFDADIYATDVAYFGQPSDIDTNGHVIVLLTKNVNKGKNILGFVFSGDLFPAGDPGCPQSNGGEIYYGEVPDPSNTIGTGARAHDAVVDEMPQLIAHEFTHVIQNSQRFILHSGLPMASWAMEGQATLAEELAGDAVLGNTSGQNYSYEYAFRKSESYDGFDWYADEVDKLIAYYGGFGTGGVTPGAPDQCTVYGNLQLMTPCDPAAFYGASWILQRYIGDQYGPSYPGGLQQLTRDWISKNLLKAGTSNIEALLGVDYDSLFVHFATALAVDDHANATGTSWIPAAFQITSWNSTSLAGWVQSCCSIGWLTPTPISFGTSTTQSRTLRGGSTAYAIVSGAGASHTAMAIEVTTTSGGALPTTLRPTLWIVRIQ